MATAKITKRNLVKATAGAGLLAAFPLLRGQAGTESDAPLASMSQVVAISDVRFEDARSFAKVLSHFGARHYASRGDIIHLWYRDLRHRVTANTCERFSLCGLTTVTDFELLQQCLRENTPPDSLQLVYKGLHQFQYPQTVEHELQYSYSPSAKNNLRACTLPASGASRQSAPSWCEQLAFQLMALGQQPQRFSDAFQILSTQPSVDFPGVLVSWHFA